MFGISFFDVLDVFFYSYFEGPLGTSYILEFTAALQHIYYSLSMASYNVADLECLSCGGSCEFCSFALKFTCIAISAGKETLSCEKKNKVLYREVLLLNSPSYL